jgi:uncharacterized Fe-S cluster-containing radical SAM superfamily protein
MSKIELILDPRIDSIEDVLHIRREALKLYAEGKTIMEYHGEGASFKREFVDEIAEILWKTRIFLKQADPEKYGYIIRSTKQIRV